MFVGAQLIAETGLHGVSLNFIYSDRLCRLFNMQLSTIRNRNRSRGGNRCLKLGTCGKRRICNR